MHFTCVCLSFESVSGLTGGTVEFLARFHESTAEGEDREHDTGNDQQHHSPRVNFHQSPGEQIHTRRVSYRERIQPVTQVQPAPW